VSPARRVGDAITTPAFEREPDWYKDAVIYELHVRAFHDSDGDGIGDFDGLRSRLDYLHDLGVTALWLLPFQPSPLRDDGYDIADYRGVHPSYGTLRSFRRFLDEAHRRGLRVITELVMNHTSDQHPWFQRAREAPPGSRWRDFYVWSDTPEKYQDARVIFQDFEQSNWTWDPVAQSYYWHRFYSHQPDLNFENPAVRREMLRAVDHWFKMGVDGLRLDAVPYLYEEEGTNCENLPKTHAFLRELRLHVDKYFDDRMLLAEANQWPEDASAYFGEGDECHMAFHFPLMPRLFMALRMEDRFPVVDILQQTPEIPESAQWALFLRNHDELTLEMVTDEERDYMYRVYAHDPAMRINLGIRRRLAPLLQNHRQKVELMLGLLMSLPGTPVLYYGDEIGMGDNVYLGDRDSVRTPMQWSGDRNAGFSAANPHRLFLPVNIDPEYHYETVNVEAQQHNSDSLLWWMRRLISLRRRHAVFSRGELEMLAPDNPHVLSFIRRHGDQEVLVAANLSRFAQYVELDLHTRNGAVPVELFGHTPFPAIGELPYLLTLPPYGFYWFELTRPVADDRDGGRPERIVDWVPGAAPAGGRAARQLVAVLSEWLPQRRWFGSKQRPITSLKVDDVIPLDRDEVFVLLVRVEYATGDPETYTVPVAVVHHDDEEVPTDGVIAALRADGTVWGTLVDAHYRPAYGRELLDALIRRRRFTGRDGTLLAVPSGGLSTVTAARRAGETLPEPRLVGADQSNTSILFGDELVLKTLRRVEPGLSPDVEFGRVFERRHFEHAAEIAGSLTYRPNDGAESTVAIVNRYVAHEQEAWGLALASAGRFFELMLSREDSDAAQAPLAPGGSLLDLLAEPPPPWLVEISGDFFALAELLGRRTAELHAVVATSRVDPAFAPEPITALYQRGVYQSMRTSVRRAMAGLRRGLRRLPPELVERAELVLAREDELLERVRRVIAVQSGQRIRIHGDLHLGQVLATGRDFVFIDFEGEPARPLSERRIKRSPVRDVAGLLRSFDYAARAAVRDAVARGVVPDEPRTRERFRPWEDGWSRRTGAAFLGGYLGVDQLAAVLPDTREDLLICLEAHLVEKAAYEVSYELSHRPDWVEVPLEGLLALLGDEA
jgi:maltose alpha-D-glucosyltransferase/alpha-amylase